jgi:hypothetical protein
MLQHFGMEMCLVWGGACFLQHSWQWNEMQGVEWKWMASWLEVIFSPSPKIENCSDTTGDVLGHTHEEPSANYKKRDKLK